MDPSWQQEARPALSLGVVWTISSRNGESQIPCVMGVAEKRSLDVPPHPHRRRGQGSEAKGTISQRCSCILRCTVYRTGPMQANGSSPTVRTNHLWVPGSRTRQHWQWALCGDHPPLNGGLPLGTPRSCHGGRFWGRGGGSMRLFSAPCRPMETFREADSVENTLFCLDPTHPHDNDI